MLSCLLERRQKQKQVSFLLSFTKYSCFRVTQRRPRSQPNGWYDEPTPQCSFTFYVCYSISIQYTLWRKSMVLKNIKNLETTLSDYFPNATMSLYQSIHLEYAEIHTTWLHSGNLELMKWVTVSAVMLVPTTSMHHAPQARYTLRIQVILSR